MCATKSCVWIPTYGPRKQSVSTRSEKCGLVGLATTLNVLPATWPADNAFIGSYGFIPKALKTPTTFGSLSDSVHFSHSDPEDAWRFLLQQCGDNKPTVEFRPVAHFTVNMYVICALWVNHIGHKYDACLSSVARGSRLRRLRRHSGQHGPPPFHINAPGSFQPYFYCYKEWRDLGLKSIRQELIEGRRVVALTMDLAAFYHNIDAEYLLHQSFWKASRFIDVNGEPLCNTERQFTEQLINSFRTWGQQLPHLPDDSPAGVPVGPSAPRVIANVLLCEFDRLVVDNLIPIYYGRYVDDIFLVIRDNGDFKSADDVVAHLTRRIDTLKVTDDKKALRLSLPYADKSKLLFKTDKQRIFMLAGEVGEDLLDTIKSKIDEVSSEWRLLPNLADLERSPAARVLTAAKRSDEDADSLRKADELSLRRLGFSLMLRSVNAVSRDIPPQEWRKERERFYRFVHRHVITPMRFLDLNDYLPRLIGLAVACGDWDAANRMVRGISNVIRILRENIDVCPPKAGDAQWNGYLLHLRLASTEAFIGALPVGANLKTAKAEKLVASINAFHFLIDDLFADTCDKRAANLFWSDLARAAFQGCLDGRRSNAATATGY